MLAQVGFLAPQSKHVCKQSVSNFDGNISEIIYLHSSNQTRYLSIRQAGISCKDLQAYCPQIMDTVEWHSSNKHYRTNASSMIPAVWTLVMESHKLVLGPILMSLHLGIQSIISVSKAQGLSPGVLKL